MGRHVQGAPQMIVQSMTGAGSVRAANYVYVNAPRDGTVIAAVNQNMPMYQLLGGAAAHFDASKFNWLGSIVSSNGILTTWHTGIVTLTGLRHEGIVSDPAGHAASITQEISCHATIADARSVR
jgi:hypothetical protein